MSKEQKTLKSCYILDRLREWLELYGNQNHQRAEEELQLAIDELYEYQQKDQRIAELEEQLKNAIVPKFKIGQECYLIDNDFNYFKNTKEFNIVRSKIKKQENWYYVKDYGVCHEDELFSTKEEAEAKLKELEEQK